MVKPWRNYFTILERNLTMKIIAINHDEPCFILRDYANQNLSHLIDTANA